MIRGPSRSHVPGILLVCSFNILSIRLVSIVLATVLLEDFVELVSGLMSLVKLDVEVLDQVLCLLIDLHVLFVEVPVTLCLLNLADVEDIVDGVDDLADLLGVLIFLVDLIFEVLLENGVGDGDLLDLALDDLHLPLLVIKGVLEHVEFLFLLGTSLLHLFVDLLLPRHKLLILVFKTDKPVLKVQNLSKALTVPRLVIDDALQEVGEDLVPLQILLLILQLNLSLRQRPLQLLDLVLFLLDLLLLLLKLLLLSLSLE